MTATAIGSYATLAGLKLRLFNDAATVTADDTELTSLCDQINQFIESPQGCGRVIAPIGSAVYTFDGDGSRVVRYPKGIRAVSLLECQLYTSAGYSTVPSSQYFLRPGPTDRPTGWPYTRIEFTNYPIGTFSYFPVGFDTVRVTMTTGFDAIPDDITDLALTVATRAWHAVQAGQSDIIGTDEMGRPLVSRLLSRPQLDTIDAYSTRLPA